ncbi:MAG TPA: GHKL domain-containing protein [Bacteroides sp.]|nr:GHKL domain-containing protein [Bacteroides sp.]
MVFRSHRIRILIRVLLIAGFMGLMYFAMSQEKWYVGTGVSALLVVLLLIELYRFIDRSNLEFINLLESLKYQDFTRSYRRKYSEKTFRDLESSYKEVLSLYKEAKIDQAAQYQYLQIVLEHIQVALVCFDTEGEVILFNKAASRLFKRTGVSNLEPLKAESPELYRGMIDLEVGKRELIRISNEEEVMRLAVTATGVRIREKNYKLVSLQDIRHELDEQELDSWQKLIRVLTHEIMNSVTPVSSLSAAINEMLMDEHGRRRTLDDLEEDDLEDMYSGLSTIEERSKGLVKFVSDYKNLTRLPKPTFESIPVSSLFGHIENLFARDMEQADIDFSISDSTLDLSIWADAQMIHQVLINLLNNSMDAVESRKMKTIRLGIESQDGKTNIRVSDNGKGIDPEYADKVFIPFFTTRKKGSGIGLSLSRQIMRLHKGSIYFHSDEKGTTFTLEF